MGHSGFCPGLGWAALEEQNCKAELTEHQKAAKSSKTSIFGFILSTSYTRSTPALQKINLKSSFMMISPSQALSPSTSGMFLPVRNSLDRKQRQSWKRPQPQHLSVVDSNPELRSHRKSFCLQGAQHSHILTRFSLILASKTPGAEYFKSLKGLKF